MGSLRHRPLRRHWRALVAAGVAVATLGMASAASAINIGVDTGSGSGASSGIGPSGDLLWLHDYLNNGTPVEGWNDASINWMLGSLGRSGISFTARGGLTRIRQTCQGAIRNAVARSGGRTTKARVVGLAATVGRGSDGETVLWGDNASDFNRRFQANWNSHSNIGGAHGDLNNWSTGDVNRLHSRANQAISSMSGVNNQVVCLAVNEYEPPDIMGYHLNVATTHQGNPPAGANTAVHDHIVAGLNAGESWSGSAVRANVWLNWDGYPATDTSRKAEHKTVTISRPGQYDSPNFTPADFGWKTWAPGRYWYDIDVPKQGSMMAAVNTPDRQASETYTIPTGSTKKTIARMDGSSIDGRQVVPGTLYMQSITGTVTPAASGYNTQATVTDHIMDSRVWVGAKDHDDLTKVTVEHDGKTVTQGVKITKTATKDGFDVTATISNPDEGEYKLNVPAAEKADDPSTGKQDRKQATNDRGCTVANTGASSVCSDTKVQPGEHPETNKAWLLKNGKLVEDKEWTNKVGADTETFLPGDPVSAVVNGHIPDKLAENLDCYTLTDDWSNASKYVDFAQDSGNPNYKVSVYVNGQDRTSDFNISVDSAKHTTTATAKDSFLAGTKSLTENQRATVQLVITGTFRSDYRTAGHKQSLSNSGSQKINTEGKQANVPSVFTWTPNPNKEWARNTRADGTGSWIAVTDASKSNNVNGDQKVYREHDPLAALVNGTVPTGLGYAPTSIKLTEDYSKNSYFWTPSDLSKIRVFEQDLAKSDDALDANDANITTSGTDVTSDYKITVDEKTHTITAAITAAHAQELKGLSTPRQITLLVPGMIKLAHGKGSVQVRTDYGATTIAHRKFVTKDGREFYKTCSYPNHSTDTTDKSNLSKPILNDGSETAGTVTVKTNEPPICVTVPQTPKSVVAEKSQGADQHDADTQYVRPNQRIEYELDPSDRITSDDAYQVESVSIRDQFSSYATVDAQTIEVRDADGDDLVAGRDYTTSVDNAHHVLALTLSKSYIAANYKPGQTVSLHVRFEAQLDDLKGLKPSQGVDNHYEYKVNNAVTVSNTVSNRYVPPTPSKKDVQHDSTVDINGKRLLLGDVYDYRLDLDATNLTQGTSVKNADGSVSRSGKQVYRVQRLGMRDAYDSKHLSVDAKDVKVLDASGKDVTSKFNVMIEDHVLRVYAKTVDTVRPDTGARVKGDPQPSSLKAYEAKKLDRLSDPYIDQGLLGQHYTIVMPAKVILVDADGVKVTNTAVEKVDDQEYLTNEVSNELKMIDPSKDVVINVGSASANGRDIYKGHYFLYRLDSSKRPSNLAYPKVTEWRMADRLDTTVDRFTGQWAVYAATDVPSADGKTVVYRKGAKIAGNKMTDDPLFTVRQATDGTVTVEATQRFLAMSTASGQLEDTDKPVQFTVYLQVQRLRPVEHHTNMFHEFINGVDRPSNVVWTRTPDQTPAIRIEKFDTKSGLRDGDRNQPSQALTVSGPTSIAVRIWNTGKSDIHGLTFSDRTIAGDGNVSWDLKSLDALKTVTLHPGDHVDVTGTLDHVASHHTDRATVRGVPLLPCAADQPDIDSTASEGPVKYCDSTSVQASDDWNGKAAPASAAPAVLSQTGASVAIAALVSLLMLSAGGLMVVSRRRGEHDASAPRHSMD